MPVDQPGNAILDPGGAIVGGAQDSTECAYGQPVARGQLCGVHQRFAVARVEVCFGPRFATVRGAQDPALMTQCKALVRSGDGESGEQGLTIARNVCGRPAAALVGRSEDVAQLPGDDQSGRGLMNAGQLHVFDWDAHLRQCDCTAR
ncbi:hypothetical protein SDC9_179172 [bioreactor metagenome]|uniref:Uncharacterized protein n=1 Tax=bioreactor metagenome TaxID=1076179 RepID=A0A645GY95_9ZZZZ